MPVKSTLTKDEALYLIKWLTLRYNNDPNYPFPSKEYQGLFSVRQELENIKPNDISSLTDWISEYLSEDNRKRFWSAWRQNKKKSNEDVKNKTVKKHMTLEAADKITKLANKHGCQSVSEYIIKYL